MFLMFAFLLFGLTFAEFPSDYDYDEISAENAVMTYTTAGPAVSVDHQRRIRENIKKLFAGRELPSELTDPAEPVNAIAGTEPHKPTLEAVAATEEISTSEYPIEYVFRLKEASIDNDNDNAAFNYGFNYGGLRSSNITNDSYSENTTTTGSTTTATCKDDEGYRIRCTNSTSTTKRTTTTTPMSTQWEDTPYAGGYMFGSADNESVIAMKKARHREKQRKFYENLSKVMLEREKTASEAFIRTSEAADINKLLVFLHNLTYIYDTDIVQRLNRTLNESGYPYCPSTVTTPTHSTTTLPPEPVDNVTGITTTRCYVCGLEAKGIPDNSRCADAFASDFFPTAPVDFTARGSMTRYKKLCKYINKPSWHLNGTSDRLMWGRWTGGCAVRWIDLSGIYTQRTCRNRHRPALGNHYASKRMAKLEYALNKEENGCIISPQASLVPFSRGVSLFARFHACVCSGNYCNRAERLSTLSVWPMVVFVQHLYFF